MEWKDKTLFARIIERWDELKVPYERLKTAREYICDFFRPDLGVDYDEAADMLMLGENIFEGSGPWVARTASTSFQGNTVSKKLDWFKYGFSDDRIAGIDELDEFCQSMREHNAAVYQRGNFYDIQPQFTLDGWTIGSPLMFVERDLETDHMMCIPIHWLTYRIFYDRFNCAEGVIIKDDQWTAKKCFDKFCPGRTMKERLSKAEQIFSKSLQTAIEQGQLNSKFTIWRAVFRSSDPIWGDFRLPNNTRYFSKTWYSVYFEETGLKEKQNDPLLSDGYRSKPFVHWDFDKKVWECSSRTPAFSAIYDDLNLIQIFKNYVDNTQLKVRPSMAALLGTEKRLDFRPGGLNLLNSSEWNYLPKPIEQVGEVRFERENFEMLRESLSRHFHLETFRMFSDLSKQKGKDFRVLQLMEMAGERITQLLPMIESHESYLAQVDERVRAIELESGQGPYNKANIENVYDIISHYLGPMEADLVKIQPEFIGTLRQKQQQFQKLQPILYGINALSEIGEAMGDPNFVGFMIKRYLVGDATLQAVNFQQKLVNEEADYNKSVEAFMQDQAMQRQFAQVVELMKAGKGMEAGPDNVLGMLTGATA
uniref:Putative head tail connector protein n=1 Tax=viral metagenome TaxID=1070528 RepID=A0A6M3KNX4_9ZZZZ